MGNEMTLVLWSGDPLQGVVAWGSVGLMMWSLVAALLGSVLGMLRSVEVRRQQRPTAPRPRPRGIGTLQYLDT
jgi:hypothetical protein